MEMNETIKAALIVFDLSENASLTEIRAEYLDKTSQPKLMKVLATDENLQKEFTRYYKAYVTLVKNFNESELNSDMDYYPTNQIFQFHFNQGVYYFITQNYLKAGDKFQDAYAIDNQNCLVLIYLGVLLIKRKNYYAAEKYFRDAIKIDKNSDEAWFYLAESYYKAGELRKALNIFETAKNLNSSRKEIAFRIKEIKEKMSGKPQSPKKASWLSRFLEKFS